MIEGPHTTRSPPRPSSRPNKYEKNKIKEQNRSTRPRYVRERVEKRRDFSIIVPIFFPISFSIPPSSIFNFALVDTPATHPPAVIDTPEPTIFSSALPNAADFHRYTRPVRFF